MRYVFIMIAVLLSITASYCQKYELESGTITFFSSAPMEDIEAINKKPKGLFDLGTSELVLLIPIKEFQFDKKLMQEHFNEKYLESDRYPNGTFSGRLSGLDSTKRAWHRAEAVGKLNIHGVEKLVELVGEVKVEDNVVRIKSNFKVLLKDHNITIPQLFWRNIAEEVKVTVACDFRIRQ
jgi:hypothetical protein